MIQSHFNHADCSVYNHLSCIDDSGSLLTLEHDSSDFRCISKICDSCFDDLQPCVCHFRLDLFTDSRCNNLTGATETSLISLSVTPSHRDELVELMQNSKEVLQCYHVTGAYTFLVKVSCGSMPQLEHLILQFQKLGTTSTQIILSTPVNHGDLDALML